MAITKSTEAGKIEVVGLYNSVQVRSDIIVKDGSTEISRSYHRHVLDPGTLDGSDNLVARDISGEDAKVQAVCNAVWTDAIKLAWKNKLIADKDR
jgi:hypothetical protein|tara:strand:+ start:739 stop:1023 length:285 start_codon:yes stop_codon:yes gene_type:complete